jgi:hypothetical protein
VLPRQITYTDYSDDPKEHTEIFRFNLTKIEIVGMEVEHKEGLSAFLDGLLKAEDLKSMFETFKEIVLISYGERNEDSKGFDKSPEIKKKFANSAAYHQLCYELMASQDGLAEFLLGVIPKDLVNNEEAQKILKTASLAAVPDSPTPEAPPQPTIN